MEVITGMLTKLNYGKLGLVSLMMLSLSPAALYAADSSDNTNDSGSASKQSMQSTIAQQQQQLLQQMQSQMNALKLQVSQLQSKSQSNSPSNGEFTTYKSRVRNNSSDSTLYNTSQNQEIVQNITKHGHINMNDNSKIKSSGSIDFGSSPSILSRGQVSYIGAYSADNPLPISQISDALKNHAIISQRQKFSDYAIMFGAQIEADAQLWWGNSNINPEKDDAQPPSGQGFYVGDADLYFLANVGHYVAASFDFDADQREGVELGDAMVTIGNLDTSPFFVTFGWSRPTVGLFDGGGPWTNGILRELLRPDNVANVSINYKNDVWSASAALFSTNDNTVDFSTGLFYANDLTNNLSLGWNVGYMYNLNGAGADISDAMSDKDTAGLINMETSLAYNTLGGTLQASAGWGQTTARGNFNGDGRDVYAGGWYTALNYARGIFNYGVTYGQTYGAAAVPMDTAFANPRADSTTSGIRSQLIFSAQGTFLKDDDLAIGPEYALQELYNGKHLNVITLDMTLSI